MRPKATARWDQEQRAEAAGGVGGEGGRKGAATRAKGVDGSSGGEGEEDCVVVAQGAVEHPGGVGIGSKRGGQEEAVQAREGGGPGW